MFNWGIWCVETVIATFFISGFVVIYNRTAVSLRTTLLAEAKHSDFWVAFALTAFVFVMVGFCELAKYINPINADAYMNWALYVLFVPLLNREVGLRAFLVRYVGIVGFWALNSNIYDPFFLVSLVSITVLLGITWRWRSQASKYWLLHLSLAIWAACAFWFTQTQLALLDIVMAIVMFALMNVFTIVYWSAERITSLEHKRLVKQVNQDTLTGAGSLFAFKEDLTTQIQLTRRQGGKLTLVMFDIDFFKRVNDSYGHAAGNYVLTEVAHRVEALIQQNSAYDCELYRTGGEEFNIIFQGAGVDDVSALAEQIMLMIRAQDFAYEDNTIHVTLSMGITELLPDDTGLEDIYERADAHLYAAKRSGRDRICATETLAPDRIPN